MKHPGSTDRTQKMGLPALRAGLVLSGITAAMVVALPPAHGWARSRIDTEMQNLRALPKGYKSWCENGHLILKAPASARFRIAKAALCAGKPDGHVVCTASREAGAASRRNSTPLCSEIDAPGA